jgi:hypothetical protein
MNCLLVKDLNTSPPIKISVGFSWKIFKISASKAIQLNGFKSPFLNGFGPKFAVSGAISAFWIPHPAVFFNAKPVHNKIKLVATLVDGNRKHFCHPSPGGPASPIAGQACLAKEIEL